MKGAITDFDGTLNIFFNKVFVPALCCKCSHPARIEDPAPVKNGGQTRAWEQHHGVHGKSPQISEAQPRHWRVRERVEEDAGNPEGVFTRVQMFYQVQLQVFKTNVMKVNLYSHANDN